MEENMINEIKSREEFLTFWNRGERDFSNCRFVNDLDLSNLKLDGINLNNATAKGLILENSSISDSKLNNAFLYNATLKKTKAKYIEAEKVFLTHSIIEDCDFQGSNLENGNFKFVDEEQLRMCNLDDANIKGTELDFFKKNSNKISLSVLLILIGIIPIIFLL
jgi:uncharacterized protein YjbI with pentapeptide repeats